MPHSPKASEQSLTAQTIDFWQSYAGVTLTRQEADEAAANVAELFNHLHKWKLEKEGGTQ
jgi:hypothetical protein